MINAKYKIITEGFIMESETIVFFPWTAHIEFVFKEPAGERYNLHIFSNGEPYGFHMKKEYYELFMQDFMSYRLHKFQLR